MRLLPKVMHRVYLPRVVENWVTPVLSLVQREWPVKMVTCYGKEQLHRECSWREPSSGRPACGRPFFCSWHGFSYPSWEHHVLLYTLQIQYKEYQLFNWTAPESRRIFHGLLHRTDVSKFEYRPNRSSTLSILLKWLITPRNKVGAETPAKSQNHCQPREWRRKRIYPRNANNPNPRPLNQHLASKTTCSWQRDGRNLRDMWVVLLRNQNFWIMLALGIESIQF